MSEKTLNLTILGFIKKNFKSKKPIDLMSVNGDQVVVSDKFNHNSKGCKYFIGYQEDETIKPLCIDLPQMSGYMKYLKSGGKNMSFLLKMTECGKNTNKFGM